MSAGIALLVVAIASGQTSEEPPPPELAAEMPKEPARFRAALEASVMSFPSGTTGGMQDFFIVPVPTISFEGGPDFALALGAPLRIRVFDDPPAQRDRDYEGLLRHEDWDQFSDFGQIIRELQVGSEASAVSVRVGPFASYTLGSGQLLSRYSNRTNPDYHPAGARGVVAMGPTRTEIFASDVLGGRILAAEVALDAGWLVEGPEKADRFHVALSALHDLGRAGGATPPITLGWLEGTAAFVREEAFRFGGYGGVGARAFEATGSSIGAALGLALEGETPGMRIGGRGELRKFNAGFRPGMVSYDYELARFAAVGLGSSDPGDLISHPVGLADASLPDDFSVRAELSIELGGADPASEALPGFVISASGEHFLFGRTDVDVALSGRALEGRAVAGARVAVTGLGDEPRLLATLEGRYRFAASFYAVAQGGTVFFPQPFGHLAQGYFVGGGVGVDFER